MSEASLDLQPISSESNCQMETVHLANFWCLCASASKQPDFQWRRIGISVTYCLKTPDFGDRTS